jgi:hypothetical protein
MRPGQEAIRLVKLKFNKALVVFFFLQVTQRVSKYRVPSERQKLAMKTRERSLRNGVSDIVNVRF